MDKLFYPCIELNIAGAAIRNQFAALDLWLSRKEPADLCEFTLKTGLPDLGLAKDSAVEIAISYNLEQKWTVFSGYVVEAQTTRFVCKDEGIKLFRSEIIQTFLDATPQDIIRFGLRKAGISEMKLDSKPYPTKPRFIASGENISELVRRVNTTWGINNDWYFAGKTFCWSSELRTDKPIYTYEYGENIIDLEFSTDRDPHGQRKAGQTSGAGKLSTVVSPFVDHSQEVIILWPETKSSRYFVEKVHHFLNENGALRTELFIREMEG